MWVNCQTYRSSINPLTIMVTGINGLLQNARLTMYEKMKQIEAEHNQAGAIPLTQEELSIAALKKRPGDVKGLGLRPSSSIRTICESATIKEYVTRLEKKLEEPDETIEKLLEANKQQQVFNASMMEFLIEKGYAGHLGSGGLSSNG
ncbi:hypothetical protein Vadar_020712 [Vaccinium darrowii]|uniref:Uncharacterized protein n=1 Tax=Vaccinium darrowii TaxID=229202 RepID=A0ACB7X2I9_9ERIC|nr:hypothetical protein Vadar_020712 [Vaccinium darrowii]